ncbi:SGNH/GDSL hydrolase family protein [Calycomorphotria hydatis]|uniref:GDSL-like Lipase/Acylhydrolase n=1 Tax=Calycomorphotria hydatis TaxID=2528027 RepID=A0A517TEY8_9PLAN|nr:SGNH/GDSL hydrolase family protein [Calycomorphotria hydatis]QDT66933.1 GDSL-like Lipase/Acylhydrolase [Calycomorphotria hydatis]
MLNSTRFTSLLLLGLISTAGQLTAEDRTPSRWESSIQKFEKQDIAEPQPKHGIVFVGSSSIRKWDLDKSFPDLPVINRGFGGSEMIDTLTFADRIVTNHEPRAIVVYAGDNDIAHETSPEDIAKHFRQFVEHVESKLDGTKIHYIAIKPSIKRWSMREPIQVANKLIEDYCLSKPNVTFVDIWTPMLGEDGLPRKELFVKDGLHMSDEGYVLWKSKVLPLIAEE